MKILKKFVVLFFLIMFPLTSCSTISELNEKVKGDGVPYIPGI